MYFFWSTAINSFDSCTVSLSNFDFENYPLSAFNQMLVLFKTYFLMFLGGGITGKCNEIGGR